MSLSHPNCWSLKFLLADELLAHNGNRKSTQLGFLIKAFISLHKHAQLIVDNHLYQILNHNATIGGHSKVQHYYILPDSSIKLNKLLTESQT